MKKWVNSTSNKIVRGVFKYRKPKQSNEVRDQFTSLSLNLFLPKSTNLCLIFEQRVEATDQTSSL